LLNERSFSGEFYTATDMIRQPGSVKTASIRRFFFQ
jgi:hypothetical protein